MKSAILLLVLASACQASKILLLSPLCSKSHKYSFMPMVEALADKGHHVTVVTPFSSSGNVNDNIEEIVLSDNDPETLVLDWFEIQNMNVFSKVSTITSRLNQHMQRAFENLMADARFQQIYNSEDVDLIIVDAILNEMVLPVVEYMNRPFIYYSTTYGTPMTVAAMSIATEYASVPSLSGFKVPDGKMEFLDRLTNMLSSELNVLLRNSFLPPVISRITQKYFPNARSILEIEREASLCLMNYHPVTAWSRPLPLNVIPIPALHVRPGKALPEKLQTFADGAGEAGLIVFTLGSTIKVSQIPTGIVKEIFQAFSKLPQQIICKWEKADVQNVPPNVLLVDWLPQQDLLAHPNTRLFISHGGLLGIQETVYHAVPLLGIPIGNDQLSNLAKSKSEGYAMKLDWDEISETTLFNTISTILQDPSYQENADRVSRLLRDELIPGRQAAVYWVEYVIRHGGAKHLEPASKNTPLYQHYLLDVLLFLLLLSILATFSLILTIRCLQFCYSKVKVKKD